MTISPQTIAFINLAVQVLIIVTVLTAAYLARKKRKFKNHCTIMRFVVPVQILSTFMIMLPSLIGFLKFGDRGPFFDAEVLIHHSLGIAIFLIFILVNLLFQRVIKIRIRLRLLMRTAFSLWMVVFLIGLHLFIQVWL